MASRESEQTSLWSFRARALDEPIQEVKQMTTETAEVIPSDPCWCDHRHSTHMASD